MELNAAVSRNTPGRILGADLARVVMIFLMIQGHTLDALWSMGERQGTGYELWLLLRGLTAPAFLLLSGFSFALANRRWWLGDRDWSRLQRRINRFLLLVVLGYTMHLPARTLGGFADLDADGWRSFFQADVLQCIGISLLVLQLTLLVTRTARWFGWTTLVAGVLVVLLTPLSWMAAFSRVPVVLSAYLNGTGGSQFPLFPWAAYLFFGAALGCLFINGVPKAIGGRLALGGFVMTSAGMLLSRSSLVLYPAADFWKTAPSLFVTRLGCVVALLGLCILVSPLLQNRGKWIQPVAGESLIIYYVHVCILYGSVWSTGLRQYVGASLTLSAALTCAGAMIACMIGMALSWNWMKKTWRAQPAWLKTSYWFPS